MKKAFSFLLLLAVVCGIGWSQEKLLLPASVTGPMTLDFVQGYRFDPLTSQPTLPTNLTITGYPKDTKGYYLVQFAGPIDYRWKEHVNDLGGFVLGYQPNYAFVVRMTEAVKAKVEQLPEVRWVGLLQPAYKLFPYNLLGAGSRTVIVVLHPGESDGAFEARAKEFGGTNFIWDINEVNKSVRFDVDASRIPEIASLTEVDWIEPWSEWTLDNVDAQWVTQMGWRPAAPPPTERIIWQKGVRGDWMEGSTYRYVVVGRVDDGFDPLHWAFLDPSVPLTSAGEYPAHRKVISYKGTYTRSSHGTHTAGSIAGNDSINGGVSLYDGMAPMAKLIVKTYSSVDWDMNTWWGDVYQGNSAGKAFSMNMSLSRKDSFNLYVYADMTADQFHWRYKDFIECNSMGGSGGNTMGHPVIAKDLISCGATLSGISSNGIASFSSRGPCADGRRKPNLVTPGDYVYSAQYNTSNSYQSMSGVSMCTAVASGNVALVRCYFEKGFYPTGDTLTGTRLHPSGALVKAVLTVGADPNITGYTVPDNNIGWGRIDLDSSLYFAGDLKQLRVYDDTTRGLATGDSMVYPFALFTNHPLRAVLCYSDTAGPMRASRTLVNDLDLVVISPTGTVYLGNVWSGGQSVPGGLRDSINETECFRLNAPEIGVWRFIVKGHNVPVGGAKGQPYALAITGIPESMGTEEGARESGGLPQVYELSPPSPNPSHDEVALRFALPRSASVTLEVFTVTGRRVKTLIQGSHPAGVYRIRWDECDGFGRKVPSGVYFYRLETPGVTRTKRMVVVR